MASADDGATDEVTTRADVTGGIVVGHDGSSAAGDAVRWAADLAQRLDEPLHVVRAWSLTNAPRPKTLEMGYIPPMADFEAAVCEALTADLAGLSLPVEPTVHAVRHGAARALLESGEDATMIVVGRRGAGGFRGLGFGSTADQVVRHAPCPVVVVPVHARD
jgi:nucleotide-binding universal stress UspA family protein